MLYSRKGSNASSDVTFLGKLMPADDLIIPSIAADSLITCDISINGRDCQSLTQQQRHTTENKHNKCNGPLFIIKSGDSGLGHRRESSQSQNSRSVPFKLMTNNPSKGLKSNDVRGIIRPSAGSTDESAAHTRGLLQQDRGSNNGNAPSQDKHRSPYAIYHQGRNGHAPRLLSKNEVYVIKSAASSANRRGSDYYCPSSFRQVSSLKLPSIVEAAQGRQSESKQARPAAVPVICSDGLNAAATEYFKSSKKAPAAMRSRRCLEAHAKQTLRHVSLTGSIRV